MIPKGLTVNPFDNRQTCKKILYFKTLKFLSLHTWLDSLFVHNTFFKLYNSNVVGKCSERYEIFLFRNTCEIFSPSAVFFMWGDFHHLVLLWLCSVLVVVQYVLLICRCICICVYTVYAPTSKRENYFEN